MVGILFNNSSSLKFPSKYKFSKSSSLSTTSSIVSSSNLLEKKIISSLSFFFISFITLFTSAPSLSILFMKIKVGTLYLFNNSHIVSLCP